MTPTGENIKIKNATFNIFFQGLARLGAAVTGIDASKELIEIAEHHKHVDPKIAENKPKYIHSTVEVRKDYF